MSIRIATVVLLALAVFFSAKVSGALHELEASEKVGELASIGTRRSNGDWTVRAASGKAVSISDREHRMLLRADPFVYADALGEPRLGLNYRVRSLTVGALVCLAAFGTLVARWRKVR